MTVRLFGKSLDSSDGESDIVPCHDLAIRGAGLKTQPSVLRVLVLQVALPDDATCLVQTITHASRSRYDFG